MSEAVYTSERASKEQATLLDIAKVTAEDSRRYLETVTEVATGANPDSSLSLLLLALSDILVTGARLGAMMDVLPRERFEPDVGPDADLDPLAAALSNVLEGLDDYLEVADPLVSRDVVHGSLTNDLVTVALSLTQGLRHLEAGQVEEALWWWQFSYLSIWGERASSALRVVQSVLAHVRLDAEEDVVAEAEFDALHSHES